MTQDTLNKTSPILIIGAGVFGLSTALHLGQRGDKNVTVIDKQPYDKTLYSYDKGCDAASADINKVLRCAYGADTIYSNLALAAREEFLKWNAELANMSDDPPPGLSTADTLYVNCGTLSVLDRDGKLPPFEQQSIDYLTSLGKRDTQFIVNNLEDIERAKSVGYGHCIDPFNLESRGQPYGGLLDTLGGLVYAEECCLFALHKAKPFGVKFISGTGGMFKEYIPGSEEQSAIRGVRTTDDGENLADVTIVAAGGWTPTIVSALDHLCETTAGSVCSYQLLRSSPIWDRFAPEKFPSYQFGMRDGAEGGIYGFPRDSNGIVKIGYRGTKYTNPVVQADGKERSTPITRWTEGASLTVIPATALRVIKTFVLKYLPELDEHKISIVKSRLCWYNDSFDNHLVIDCVPGQSGLMVAIGGSGHGFKYLPVLGKWIVDIMEAKELLDDEMEIKRRWQWRSLPKEQKAYNVIMQGSSGTRTLARQMLIKDDELMLFGTVSKPCL